MLMRPILKIIRNIFIYDEKEFQSKIKDVGFGGQEREESSDKKCQKNTDSDYGEEKSQEEKMDEIHEQEKSWRLLPPAFTMKL